MSKRDFRNIFEIKLGCNATQTSRNINEIWGEGNVNECTVQRWYQKFRFGNTRFDDEPHARRPSAIDNEQLKQLIEADPRKTTREVAEELNVDQ